MSLHAGYSRVRCHALTPSQAQAICDAAARGVPRDALASQYGVTRRTIQRYIARGPRPKAVVELFGLRAEFVQDGDGTPVQVTPWTVAP